VLKSGGKWEIMDCNTTRWKYKENICIWIYILYYDKKVLAGTLNIGV